MDYFKREQLPPQYRGVLPKVPRPVRAAVVGGGLAGVAAAVILAERGVQVTVFEPEAELGGRARGWTDHFPDGTAHEMERGFHAFFRQYYNLRALFKRIDPQLKMLVPMADYPVMHPDGTVEFFADVPHAPPFNVLTMVQQSPNFKWRDVIKCDVRATLDMLAYDQEKIFKKYDGISAAAYLDKLNLPAKARAMMFDVFAHSFFNPEREMSAAEMLQYFHFYFTHNPEGLTFDALDQPLHIAVWQPLRAYLEKLGARFAMATTVNATRKLPDGTWQIEYTACKPSGETGAATADCVVLAACANAVRDIVSHSGDIGDARWRADIDALRMTAPFAVIRLWFDRALRPGRPVFAAVSGAGILDSIAIYDIVADANAHWAMKTGGSEVEIHAYAMPSGLTPTQIRQQMLDGLHAIYPETAAMQLLHEQMTVSQDSPAFLPGSGARRPRVHTPDPTLALAGDFTWIPMPSGLMERAVSSGMLAANCLLSHYNVRGEPLSCVPRKGIFAAANR